MKMSTDNNAYNDLYLKYVPMLNIDETQVDEPSEIIDESINSLVVDNKIVSTLHNDQLIVFKVENLNTDFEGQVLAVLDESDNNQIENIVLPASDGDNYDCFIPISTECRFDDSETNKGNQTQYAVLPDGDASNFGILEDVATVTLEKSSECSRSTYFDSINTSKVKIAGKNLVTGQTISINNLMSKAPTRKEKVTKLRSGGVVARVNGKRIIGKILEIKPPSQSPKEIPIANVSVGQTEIVCKSELNDDDITIFENIHVKTESGSILTTIDLDKATSSKGAKKKSNEIDSHLINATQLDELTLKTLIGLLDMESFSKYLVNHVLMIKKVFKKFNMETKTNVIEDISYFKGKLQKTYTFENQTEIECWQFIPDGDDCNEQNDDQSQSSSSGGGNIDLNVDYNDMQQVDIIKVEDPFELNEQIRMGTVVQETSEFQPNIESKNLSNNFLVNLNIIVIEDENGVRKTKVIPKFSAGLICSFCNTMYPTISHLERHIKATHRNNLKKIYTCDLCKKSFLTVSTLTRHRRIHDGDKNYQCSICMKAFTTVGSLKRHFTVHVPGLRRLQCSICMQRFTDGSSLKKHLLLHTGVKPFECNVCFKRFVHLGDLNFHHKIHDLTKQFSCDVCGKEFNRHSNLMRHIEIHLDNKGNVHKCDICGSSYNFISSLTRHIVKNHMKES